MIVDSYDEINGDAVFVIAAEFGFQTYLGQSFTGNGSVLDSVEFSISKDGTPLGSLTAYVYAHTGTFGTSSLPTGSPLATSDSISLVGLVDGLQEFTFSGANQITLTNATKYCVVVTYEPDVTDDPNIDNDYVYILHDETSSTHNGNSFVRYDAGSWNVESNDVIFYVNGVAAGDGGSAPISWFGA